MSDFRKKNPDSELSDEELKKMAIEKERFKAYRNVRSCGKRD